MTVGFNLISIDNKLEHIEKISRLYENIKHDLRPRSES